MSAFFQWCKWWFITSRRCEHVSGEWRHINDGYGKARWCRKCGKCLEIF